MAIDQTLHEETRQIGRQTVDAANKQRPTLCANEYVQMVHRAPELTFFTKNYIEQYQAEILSIDPAKRGATVQLRKFLGDLVHDALDAVLADVLVAVKVGQRKMSADDDAMEATEVEPVESDANVAQQDALGSKVKLELESLVELAKDAVDEELLSLQGY